MMEATQLEFGGLRSSVVVDGSDVPQYGVQHDEGTMEATSWIVSEPDIPFAIHTNVTYRVPGENYAVRIYLDGHKAAGVVIRPEDFPLLNAASKRVSQTETRSFMFGSLELSDDDALLEAASVRELGEIKVLFYRVGTLVPSYGSYIPPPQAQKVHERAKKGLAHSVKYGGTQTDPLTPDTLHYQCLNETLLASHIIRYRPLAMLQANGIMPYVAPVSNRLDAARSPTPPPAPSSSTTSKKRKADVKPVIVLSDDDEEDNIKSENGLKEQLAQLEKKKAQRQGAGRPAKRVKQEGMKPITPGEIIDLTI